MSIDLCKTLAALAFLSAVVSPATAQNPAAGHGGGERSAQWLYDSPLCVVETITDLGGGQWAYSYEFENVDTNHLWHFGVWSDFTLSSTATWTTHPQWTYGVGQIDFVLSEYDGRNLDPNIAYIANTWGPNFPDTTDPINPGETVSGFTYVAGSYDPSPKYYFYETVESGYAVINGGYLAAVGITCTEPTAVREMTWGQIRMMYK